MQGADDHIGGGHRSREGSFDELLVGTDGLHGSSSSSSGGGGGGGGGVADRERKSLQMELPPVPMAPDRAERSAVVLGSTLLLRPLGTVARVLATFARSTMMEVRRAQPPERCQFTCRLLRPHFGFSIFWKSNKLQLVCWDLVPSFAFLLAGQPLCLLA